MSASQKTQDPEFKGLRGILFPIRNVEYKKFFPMGIMMMFILFVYNIVRDTKDTLVVNSPGGGSECLGFLKLYGVTPSAILFVILFMKLANVLEREKLFYTIVVPFLAFFGAFAFIIYPNVDIFHMSLPRIQELQAAYPNFHWVIPVVGNWSYSLFYILAELWGSVVLSMLFWQFANQIVAIEQAKRFYGLFGMVGNLGLIVAGQLIILFANQAKKTLSTLDPSISKELAEQITFGTNLKFLMSAVVIAGVLICLLYRKINRDMQNNPEEYQVGQSSAKKKKAKLSMGESFKLVITNPYLGLIAVLVLSYGVAINLVEGVWKGQIKIAFPDKNDYNKFMGEFTTWTGFITILLMIVGNNILRRLSWLKAAIITPVMVLATSVVFFYVVWNSTAQDPMSPMLGTTVVMVAVIVGLIQNVLSKGTKYSLFDSTKNMAYIPLSDEEKSKGQAAVEVIGGRAGKSGGAFVQSTLLFLIGGNVSLASLTYILGPVVIVISLIWISSVLGLNKRFLQKQKESESNA